MSNPERILVDPIIKKEGFVVIHEQDAVARNMYLLTGFTKLWPESYCQSSREHDPKIRYLAEIEIREKIKGRPEDDFPGWSAVRKKVFKEVFYTPPYKRASVIKGLASDPNPAVRIAAVKEIPSVEGYREMAHLIRECLEKDPEPAVRIAALKVVGSLYVSVPAEYREPLVVRGLNDPNPAVQLAAADLLFSFTGGRRVGLEDIVEKRIREHLSGGRNTQLIAIQMIPFAGKDRRWRLFSEVLSVSEGDWGIFKEVARAIGGISLGDDVDKLQAWLACKIFGYLEDNRNLLAQEAAASAIKFIRKEEDQAKLRALVAERIREGFSGDPSAQERAVRMIRYAPEFQRKLLILKAAGLGLGLKVIKPSSSTAPTEGGVICILCTPGSFVALQKAYESWKTWRRWGFDYVPFAPIHSYRLKDDREDRQVEVYFYPLGLTLFEWLEISGGMFAEELSEQVGRIREILKEEFGLEVPPNEENFALCFFGDGKGNPNFRRCPRVYLHPGTPLSLVLKESKS